MRDLRALPLDNVLPLRPGAVYITMADGQWDATLAAAYEAGWILLEVDGRDRPVRAYQKDQPAGGRR